ncbi:MAG: hypothetical protein M0P71_14895 [Melioribacteraceae bacterium]|nr:hypothetical protein [Melioribacteraceae bacterium]
MLSNFVLLILDSCVVYELTDGDLSKLSFIEDKKEYLATDWYYVKKISDLNKMKMDLEQLKNLRKS